MVVVVMMTMVVVVVVMAVSISIINIIENISFDASTRIEIASNVFMIMIASTIRTHHMPMHVATMVRVYVTNVDSSIRAGKQYIGVRRAIAVIAFSAVGSVAVHSMMVAVIVVVIVVMLVMAVASLLMRRSAGQRGC